jgi:hypothetical protein
VAGEVALAVMVKPSGERPNPTPAERARSVPEQAVDLATLVLA